MADGGLPYQPKVFCDFVALIGRYFYDDASIVLLDFFAREQRGFYESELKEIFRWREALLQQKLYALEKQLVLERVIESERGSKTVYLWRIHPNAFVAVEWRFTALMTTLHNKLKEASKANHFQCSANCTDKAVTLLEAAAGPKALEDDHPLCRHCGAKLTTSNLEKAKNEAENRLSRCVMQLSRVKEALNRVQNMIIPEFTSQRYEPTAAPSATTATVAPPASVSRQENQVSGPMGVDSIPWFKTPGSTPHPQPSNLANQQQRASTEAAKNHQQPNIMSAPPKPTQVTFGSFQIKQPSGVPASNLSSSSTFLRQKIINGSSSVNNGSEVGSATSSTTLAANRARLKMTFGTTPQPANSSKDDASSNVSSNTGKISLTMKRPITTLDATVKRLRF